MKVPISNYIIEAVSYLFILLFIYAAVSKITEFHNFQVQIGQSALISPYTGIISYAVLIFEIAISLFLGISRTRYYALWAAYTLMVLFTAYIIVVINYLPSVPCSCGGILEDMNWTDHLIFNISFVILALTAIFIYPIRRDNKQIVKRIAAAFVVAILSSVFIAVLYISADNKLHRENPFVRNFSKRTVTQVGEIDLNTNMLYFAGHSGDQIFLGDKMAPLHVIAYDSTLKTRKHYKITLDKEDYPFRAPQLRIVAPYFYLYDGTVPIVYRGKISDWKATTIMQNNNMRFSRAAVIDSVTMAIRSREPKTGDNILGVLTLGNSTAVKYNSTLLQKQIDGFFDTDGMLNTDPQSKKVIYTYYYRNQFIVADKNLKLISRGKTIDTTSKANIQIATLEELGETKFSAPPVTVNLASTVSGNLLFNYAGLVGRYESKSMWKKAAIIDVYNTANNTYLSSFYVHNAGKAKLSDMYVTGNNLYVVIGRYLRIYQLHKHLATEK